VWYDAIVENMIESASRLFTEGGWCPVVSPLPPGLLPSDDWATVELSDVLAELAPEEPPQEMPEALARAGVFPAGFAARERFAGGGFASGGPAERVAAGPELAERAQRAWEVGLGRLDDDQLIGVMLTWRRLAAWAAAGELAAVGELDRRRQAQVAEGADAHLAEHVADEVAAALTLTATAADRLLDLAHRLGQLPGTRAALAEGVIDPRKAAVIADETSALTPVQAAAAEHLFLPDAPSQTTGQLRVAVKRAVAFLDPAALLKRRQEAQKEARVEVWSEPSGTAGLAGRDLPPASVLAASKHLTALAQQLKDRGMAGGIDQLRAHAYTALLLGQSPTDLLTAAQSTAATADGEANAAQPPPAAGTPACAPPVPAALPAGLGGSVTLTMPLATLLGGSHEPGEVPGYGFLPARDCRTLAHAMTNPAGAARATAGPAKARWCLTLTGDDGHPLAHGCATRHTTPPTSSRSSRSSRSDGSDGGGASDSDWVLTFTIRPLATRDCDHQRETSGYRPSPSLRHLITTRQRTCSFPGCRRPATRCDLDHTIPYEAGGRTCECNLAPLCRRHHQAKQAHGWHLGQPQPGILVWTMPHGRKYVVRPGPSP
jgi:hypothetical protein